MITNHQRYRRTDRRHAIPRPRICTKVHCTVIKHGNMQQNLKQVRPTRLAQLLQPSIAFCFSLQPMTAHWTDRPAGQPGPVRPCPAGPARPGPVGPTNQLTNEPTNQSILFVILRQYDRCKQTATSKDTKT